jgi:predicted enzyme related to lactoylglutathione lyase
MTMSQLSLHARYVHTNLIAADWQALARFYETVFGCVRVPPERDLAGPAMDAGTGILAVHVRGVHLRLPGCGDASPTLEIFTYDRLADDGRRLPTAVNRPGFGHLAFSVADVTAARAAVLAAGGQPVGEIVTVEVTGGGRVTWCYVTDIDLGSTAAPAARFIQRFAELIQAGAGAAGADLGRPAGPAIAPCRRNWLAIGNTLGACVTGCCRECGKRNGMPFLLIPRRSP